MVILSIQRGHDANASIMKDEKLLCVVEAERVLNEKHARGNIAAIAAAKAAADFSKIKISDVQAIAIADSNGESYRGKSVNSSVVPAFLGTLEFFNAQNPREQAFQIEGLRREIPVYMVNHHDAHASLAVYNAGRQKICGWVIDGYGTDCGTMAYVYTEKSGLSRYRETRDQFLVGWRYSLFGHFLKDISSSKTDILDLAGKVMGLYAYGLPQENHVAALKEWFKKDYYDYEKCWDPNGRFLCDLFPGGLGRDDLSAKDGKSQDLLASMQEAYSQLMEEACENLRGHNIPHFFISGGCALNVLTNSRVYNLEMISSLHVPPNCSDAGLSMGAVVLTASTLLKVPLHKLGDDDPNKRSPYLGLPVDNSLQLNLPGGVTEKIFDDTSDFVKNATQRLLEGKMIGFIQGRAEIGPRALGNRSLLQVPFSDSTKDWINNEVKHREWWRPFAPVCRIVDFNTFFEGAPPNPYMMFSADIKPEYRNRLSAVCHVDGTTRVQTLMQKEDNPLLWDILSNINDATGVGVLLNTSYNLGGKPLVNNKADAIKLFIDKPISGLFMGNRAYVKCDS